MPAKINPFFKSMFSRWLANSINRKGNISLKESLPVFIARSSGLAQTTESEIIELSKITEKLVKKGVIKPS